MQLDQHFTNMVLAAAALQAAVMQLAEADSMDHAASEKFEAFIKDGFVPDFNDFQARQGRSLRLGTRKIKE